MKLSKHFSKIICASIIAGAFLIAASASAWEWNFGAKVTGSGNIKTEARNVGGFSGIALAVPGRAEIIQSGSEGISIESDDNILPLIDAVVEDGQLKIRFKERNMSVSTKTLKMTINVKTVDRLSVSGAGELYAATLQMPKLTSSISGSGDVRIAWLEAKHLTVSIAGSGDFSAGGKANTVEAKIAGSGDTKMGKLAADNVKISIAGSGDATVWAKETLNVKVAGSGDVGYYGDATVTKTVAGSGNVKRLGGTP